MLIGGKVLKEDCLQREKIMYLDLDVFMTSLCEESQLCTREMSA